MKKAYKKPVAVTMEYTQERAWGKKCNLALQTDQCVADMLKFR